MEFRDLGKRDLILSLFSSFSLDAKLIIAEMSSLSGEAAAAVEDVSKKLSRDLCCRFLEGWFSFELEKKRYIFAVHFMGCLWENLCFFSRERMALLLMSSLYFSGSPRPHPTRSQDKGKNIRSSGRKTTHTHSFPKRRNPKLPKEKRKGGGKRDRIGGYDAPLAVVVAVATLPVGLYQAHKVLGKGVSMTEKGMRPPKKRQESTLLSCCP